MTDAQRDAKPETEPPRTKGIGFGVFLVVAGLALLSERLGWVSPNADWLFPAILIAWGASEIYQRLK